MRRGPRINVHSANWITNWVVWLAAMLMAFVSRCLVAHTTTSIVSLDSFQAWPAGSIAHGRHSILDCDGWFEWLLGGFHLLDCDPLEAGLLQDFAGYSNLLLDEGHQLLIRVLVVH